MKTDVQAIAAQALQPYGARLTDDGFIAKGDVRLNVRVACKGGRMRMESGAGHLLASGRPSVEFVAQFVESFWYWKR